MISSQFVADGYQAVKNADNPWTVTKFLINSVLSEPYKSLPPSWEGQSKRHKHRFVPFDCLHTKSKEGDTNTMENENVAVIPLLVGYIRLFLLAIKFAEFIAV